jgi:phosphate transporter
VGQDDTIKEEDEDEGDEADDDVDGNLHSNGIGRDEASPLVKPVRPSVSSPLARPNIYPRRSMLSRLAPSFGRRRKGVSNQHEADLLEPAVVGSARTRSRSATRGGGLESSQEESYFAGRIPKSRGSRRPSDLESSEEGTTGHSKDRRTSISSASSHGPEYDGFPRRSYHSLGLVQMDPASIPSAVRDAREGEEGGLLGPVWVWTANNDFGTVLRIGYKKRISAVWLEAYALKQYVELNMTAFEKILKK